MPIIKSAKKQMRVSRKNQARNYRTRRNLKDALKTVTLVVKEGKKDEAGKALQTAYKVIDMAAKKHILHPNNAARKKSSLAKMVDGMSKKKGTDAPAKKKAAPKAKAEPKKEEAKAEEAPKEEPKAEESK